VALTIGNAVPVLAQYGEVQQVGILEYHFKNGLIGLAGKCFAVRWGSRTVLLTALHTLCSFDTSGRLIRSTKQSEIGDLLDSVEVKDFDCIRTIDTAGKSLLKRDIPFSYRGANLPGDMVAFELPENSHLSPFNLASSAAPVGTRVWLLSHVFNDRSSRVDRYMGTVTGSSSSVLAVKLDQEAPQASSGAPVVNSNNEVVGMLTDTIVGDRKGIVAVPASGLVSRLSQEFGR
jgi:hypothetical protein